MEKRIGAIIILIEKTEKAPQINSILSKHSEIIIARQGIPVRDKGIHIISIVLEGNTDEIGALTGQLGRIEGIQIKSLVMKNQK